MNEKNVYMFTIATLTGHACLAAGDGYSVSKKNIFILISHFDEFIVLCLKLYFKIYLFTFKGKYCLKNYINSCKTSCKT